MFEHPFASMKKFTGGIAELSRADPESMPAALKVELRDYACSLLDCQAKIYLKHADRNMDYYRSWLNSIATRVQVEVTDETRRRSGIHDRHCSFQERAAIIDEELRSRQNHWIEIAEKQFNPTLLSKIQRKLYPEIVDPWKGLIPVPQIESETPTTPHLPAEKPKAATRQRLEPRPELLKDLEFVGRQTAAKALGISERTLDRRVGDGTLTPVGEGHYIRFKTQDILRVLNRKKSRQSRH